MNGKYPRVALRFVAALNSLAVGTINRTGCDLKVISNMGYRNAKCLQGNDLCSG